MFFVFLIISNELQTSDIFYVYIYISECEILWRVYVIPTERSVNRKGDRLQAASLILVA